MSAPLLDRCEIIRLSGEFVFSLNFSNFELTGVSAGYTYDEKMHIARRWLLPKQLKANGLADLTVTDAAILHIATRYTREAGVRSLEREIGSVVRFKTVEWAEKADAEEGGYRSIVDVDDLEMILGLERWDGEEREGEERRGTVYGLVVMGGEY